MKTVILAEKPDQAKEYASAMQQSRRHNGYFEVKDPLFEGEVFITWAVGHLVELELPGHYEEKWSRWSLDSLPIIPERFEFRVSKDKKEVFEIVKNLLIDADEIVIATDIDREGENVAWSIIDKCEIPKNKVTKRLWINDLLPETIREGFSKMVPAASTYRYYIEAQTRQYSDWLVGMNASPLYTLNLQAKGIDSKFSVGRVQTPTLFIVYNRENEIKAFTKQKYFEIEGEAQKEETAFKCSMVPINKFPSAASSKQFLQENSAVLGQQYGMVQEVKCEDKFASSPRLFTLTDLQKEMNKRYKMTAKETLKAAQTLYEKKFLSYPRSDSRYITTKIFDQLKALLPQFLNRYMIENRMIQDSPRPRYVNDQKVKEHYAIVPTKKMPTDKEFKELSEKEKNVFESVLKRTVAMFLPDFEYKETAVVIAVGNLAFKASGKVTLSEGWKDVLEDEKVKENQLPAIKAGDQLLMYLKSMEKESQPPKHYTESQLLSKMENVGRDTEDDEERATLKAVEGIGMPSTRAEIIDGLKKREYIIVEKNRIQMTEKGNILCAAVQFEKLLSTPSMTAAWEKNLKKIGQAEFNNERMQINFLKHIIKYVNHLIAQVPKAFENSEMTKALCDYQVAIDEQAQKEVVGQCPNCKGTLAAKKGFYGCLNYPTCTFSINNLFRGKKLTKANVKQLLSNGSSIVRGIKTKDNANTYDAVVTINNKGYVQFKEFAKSRKKRPTKSA